jgi:tripartite-type tricarboxylate transporter receptor subunit TctC
MIFKKQTVPGLGVDVKSILMRIIRMIFISLSLATVNLVFAQSIPVNIKILIPFAAGGPTDIYARMAAESLRTNLKTTVITDNRPGGNGAVAVNILKSGPTDGSNLLFVSSGMITFNPKIDKSMSYDPQKDLVPIVCIAQTDIGIIVANKVPANNFREFINLAKISNPPLSLGSAGTGNILHAYIELLKDASKVDFLHVPYKGAAPSFADVLGGQISGMFISVGLAQPAVQAGKVKLIAVVGKRSALAPEIPTIAEQGVPGVELLPWFAIMGPRNLPQEMINQIASSIEKSAENEDFKKKLFAAGASPMILKGAEFSRMIANESNTWEKLVAAKKMTLD